MASPTSVRFAVSSNEKLRSILSIVERSNCDLVIHLRANQRIRALGSLIDSPSDDPQHGLGIEEYRYSVHMSPNSGANTVKLTRVNADGEVVTEVQYTLAIKDTKRFAMLYARRCSSLEDPGYDIKNPRKGKNIILGNLIPEFTLVFAVFVGPPDKEFTYSEAHDFNIHQEFFKEFSIVLVWSFLTISGHESGQLAHCVTPHGEDANLGLTAKKCIKQFNDCRLKLRNELIETLSSAPIMKSLIPYLNASTYFSQPEMKLLAAHIKLLASRGIV